MSDNFFDPWWKEKTTLPVKRVGNRWEFYFGGEVPVKDGTYGELRISTNRISDPEFLQRVTREEKFMVLKEGTPLLVALSDRSQNGKRIVKTWPKPDPINPPLGTTRWEQVTLGPCYQGQSIPEGAGLWIKVKGLERCELLSSSILLPNGCQMPEGYARRSVKSLNHAFTLLSQTYEKHRISKTGNVYTRVYYQDTDNNWYPLDDLRRGVQATMERRLLFDTWAKIEELLGWRPLSTPERGRRGDAC